MKVNVTQPSPVPSRGAALPRGASSKMIALCLVASASFLLHTPIRATADIYLQIRTGRADELIPGEVNATGHEGWIGAYALGTSASKGPHTSRARRGVPILHDFVIYKEVDKSTPKLQEAFFNGATFPQVRIKHPLGGVHPGLTIVLEEVSVSSYRTSVSAGDADDRPTEEVAFYYNKITWNYGSEPSGEPAARSGFDLLFGTGAPGRDDDGDGIDNILDPDDDNDGVDDGYELEHGLHPLVADSQYDDDDDGDTNYNEWLAGTASDDGSSQFAIRSISMDRDGKVTVKLPTIGGRRYRVMSSFDLRAERWIQLSEFETDPANSAGLTELELPAGAAAQLSHLFLKVEVESAIGR